MNWIYTKDRLPEEPIGDCKKIYLCAYYFGKDSLRNRLEIGICSYSNKEFEDNNLNMPFKIDVVAWQEITEPEAIDNC